MWLGKGSRPRRPAYALVLGGGGTKGVYELGVWEALRELDIRIHAVVGTSIGALNGVWIAQNDFDAACRVWENLRIQDVLAVPEDFRVPEGEGLWGTFRLVGQLLWKQGVLDNRPLQNLIASQLNEDKLRRSPIELGLVAFNASRLEPHQVWVKDLGPGETPQHLMASAALPGFRRTRIKKEDYLDGGFYDTVPYETARQRGYRHLIAVDLSAPGLRRPMDTAGSETVVIRNSLEMGHILDFRPDFLRRFRRLGYFDTLKVFGRLEGEWFFLKPGHGPWDEEPWREKARQAARTWPDPWRLYGRPARLAWEAAGLALGLDRETLWTSRDLQEAVETARPAAERAAFTEAASDAELVLQFWTNPGQRCPWVWHRLIERRPSGLGAQALRQALLQRAPWLDLAAWLLRTLDGAGAGA